MRALARAGAFSYSPAAGSNRGFSADGSKAEHTLGISYTPVRTAIEEEILAMQQRPGR